MDLEPQEASMVFLLLSQSVFLGIFYGTIETAASALFLSSFNSNQLPFAFTVSGIAGIILTSIYSTLQAKFTFSKLAILNLATIVILTAILWLGFNITKSKWHMFFVLVMFGPLYINSMLGFWGTAGRLFSLRQGKRLFGLIDAGLIIGIILSSYAIPIILSFNVKTKDLLFISAASVALALVFQIILTYKHTSLSNENSVNEKVKSDSSLFAMLKNPYIRLMAIFVSLSMVTAFFISFSFLAVTNLKYPDTNGFAKFFGIFGGTVMIFTLLIKTLAYSKFMKNYGLRTSLILSPTLLILLSVIAVIIGMAGGSTLASGGFVFFFLLIALSRLFSVSLKNSIEAPSFKILYQTIDSKIRHHVQARVDGTINEISALFSGVLLMALGSLSFMKLINFAQVLILLLIAWAWVAYKLYKAYKLNLEESLNTLKEKKESNIKHNTGIAGKLLRGEENAHQVLLVFNMQEKIQPIVYEKLMPYLVYHKQGNVIEYALARGSDLHIYEMLETIKNVIENDFTNQTEQLAKKLNSELEMGVAREQIITLSRSKIVADRELAARLVGEQNDPLMASHLKFLLRDFDNGIKIAAIKAAARLKNSELAPVLAEFLTTDNLGRFASDALVEIGEGALECIENIFNKTSNDSMLQSRIVRIIGNIGGSKACTSLLNKINYHDADVARLATKKLIELKYTVDTEHYYFVNQALLQILSITAWNIAARASLKDSHTNVLLQKAIANELHICYDHLFALLSLAFDAESIKHIRQNIESESAESTGYALELLELVVSDELKPILFPILDDISDSEKINQLQHFFPVDKLPLNTLVYDIINRDYNYINQWTKACALYAIFQEQKAIITNDIIAQFFNPDEILSSLAAMIIQKNEPERLTSLYPRLDEKHRIQIQQILKQASENFNELTFSKLKFIQQNNQFGMVKSHTLIHLAKVLKLENFTDGQEIDPINDDLAILVYLVAEGEIIQDNTITFTAGQFFGGIFASGYPKKFPAYTSKGDSQVYCLLQEELDKILYDSPEIAEILIKQQMVLQNTIV